MSKTHFVMLIIFASVTVSALSSSHDDKDLQIQALEKRIAVLEKENKNMHHWMLERNDQLELLTNAVFNNEDRIKNHKHD